jgi:uncharacterized protein YeaO (DUF488 family)
MLKEASVADLTSGSVTRAQGHVVIAMCFYPRGVSRSLRDEYLRVLAPDRTLFREFKDRERAHGDHDRAFAEVDYVRRFRLEPAGLTELERLSELSRTRDVYLVCQCRVGQACHRQLLLRLARERFGAPTA